MSDILPYDLIPLIVAAVSSRDGKRRERSCWNKFRGSRRSKSRANKVVRRCFPKSQSRRFVLGVVSVFARSLS